MRTMPRRTRNRSLDCLATCLLTGLLALAMGCSGEETATETKAATTKPAAPESPAPNEAPEPAEQSPADLAARGRSVYMSNCIACHSPNPAMDGALGPAVAGSSYELIETRVMRGEYPPGYTPKRESRVMIPLPHLEPDLDALTAFLAVGS